MERETRGQDQASVKEGQATISVAERCNEERDAWEVQEAIHVRGLGKPRLTALASCLMRCQREWNGVPAVLHSTIEGVLSVGGEQYENSLEKKEYWKSMWEKAAVYNGIAQWT